jgi:hypothetical protein
VRRERGRLKAGKQPRAEVQGSATRRAEANSKAPTLPKLREGWGTPKFDGGRGFGGRVGHPLENSE